MQRDPEIVRYLYWEVRSRAESAEWLKERMAPTGSPRPGTAWRGPWNAAVTAA